jgi:hypothetical protein
LIWATPSSPISVTMSAAPSHGPAFGAARAGERDDSFGVVLPLGGTERKPTAP